MRQKNIYFDKMMRLRQKQSKTMRLSDLEQTDVLKERRLRENRDSMEKPILKIQNLNLYFTQYARGLRRRELHPLRDLSCKLFSGELTAVVGASGSGKSLLAHAKERGMTIIESEHYEEDSFDAKRFVRTIFARPDRPSAIINQANAGVLSQVLVELHDNGMTIPQDVSVLSCGTYFEGEPTRFPITEMPVMPEELCAEAVNLLTSAIEERADINGSVKLIEPALKRRGSVAEAGSGGTQ